MQTAHRSRWPVMVALLGVGCVGQIASEAGTNGGEGSGAPIGRGGGVGGAANGGSASPGQGAATPGMGGAAAAGVCTAGAGPIGPMFLRRLTNQEYAQTVRDLLGVTPLVDGLPPDLAAHGFSNNSESIPISVAHLEAYRKLAEGLASALIASATQRMAVVGCNPDGVAGPACLDSFVRRFGLRAFRRPLTDEEVAAALALAKSAPAGDGSWGPAGIVVEGMLQSPSFLFRVEVGRPDPARPGVVRLTGYELATRLSYLLWGTMPDAKLFDAAASGRLDSAAGVDAQALAMMDDAKARPTVWSFASQWLRVGQLQSVDRPAAQFPRWNEALRTGMAEETRRVVDDQISRAGTSLLDLIDTRTTFVDSTMAPFYGVPAPAKNTWAPVTLPAAQGRQGILTQASVLTVTASTGATTPILRGKFIREALLCDVLPVPPPNVPALSDARVALSEREQLAQHRVNPSCGGCHSLLEPLGFGLSNFDAIGAYRASDSAGRPIDASGTIEGLPNPSFNGAAELVPRLRREPKVGTCVATHLVRFALGRSETDSETCTIRGLGDALQKGGDYRALVRALVVSDVFRYRLPADTNTGGRP